MRDSNHDSADTMAVAEARPERRHARDVTLAEILLALDEAIEDRWREEYKTTERVWWHEPRDTIRVSADSVSFELGLWHVKSDDAEWCSECGALTQHAYWYRSVPWGEMQAIARKIGELVRAGYVDRDTKYGSLYTLTAEGQSLVDAAHAAAVAHMEQLL